MKISRSKILTGLFLVMMTPVSWAEYGLNMTRGVTEISNDVYSLHMLIFWICCIIGAVVFGAMFYAMFKHRKSKGHAAAPHRELAQPDAVALTPWQPAISAGTRRVPAADPNCERDRITSGH